MSIAVLVSGRGSNLRAILEAGLPVSLVVSNVPGAAALAYAEQWDVPAMVQPFGLPRAERDRALLEVLRQHRIGFLALGGYNQILSPCLPEAFPNRIVNVHPSLLPAFAGGPAPDPQRQALEHGVKVSGCTVHLVTAEVDAGPILAQACVPVLPGDTVERLSDRILAEEHRLLPQALRWLVEGRVRVEGRRAIIAG
ncbi:MAG: phosphoribosylglycinamide formyltransferase [Chloroflexota bacterium]